MKNKIIVGIANGELEKFGNNILLKKITKKNIKNILVIDRNNEYNQYKDLIVASGGLGLCLKQDMSDICMNPFIFNSSFISEKRVSIFTEIVIDMLEIGEDLRSFFFEKINNILFNMISIKMIKEPNGILLYLNISDIKDRLEQEFPSLNSDILNKYNNNMFNGKPSEFLINSNVYINYAEIQNHLIQNIYISSILSIFSYRMEVNKGKKFILIDESWTSINCNRSLLFSLNEVFNLSSLTKTSISLLIEDLKSIRKKESSSEIKVLNEEIAFYKNVLKTFENINNKSETILLKSYKC